MRFHLTHYFYSGLSGAVLPFVLIPLGLFLIGTFLSGSPPNLDLRSSADFVIRMLSEPYIYFVPIAAAWFGWRTQNRRVAFYSGLLLSILTLQQTFR